MESKNLSAKVNKKQLGFILAVSYKTALKEHAVILDSLQLKRKYLTIKDLIDYGILS